MGLLRLMIATGTVAAGVDFPARTVVITAHSRRGAEGFSVLSSAEFSTDGGAVQGGVVRDSVWCLCHYPKSIFQMRVCSLKSPKRPPETAQISVFRGSFDSAEPPQI